MSGCPPKRRMLGTRSSATAWPTSHPSFRGAEPPRSWSNWPGWRTLGPSSLSSRRFDTPTRRNRRNPRGSGRSLGIALRARSESLVDASLRAVAPPSARGQAGPHGGVLHPIEPHPTQRRVAPVQRCEEEPRRNRGPLTLARFFAVGRAVMRPIRAACWTTAAARRRNGKSSLRARRSLCANGGYRLVGVVSRCSRSPVSTALMVERVSRAGQAVKRSAPTLRSAGEPGAA